MKNRIRPPRAHCPLRCAPILGAAALLAVLIGAHLTRDQSSAPMASSHTSDPHLVLHAHHVHIVGTLTGIALHGSLYPGFPGANSIQIDAPGYASSTSLPEAHIDLIAVMPGMEMIPARVRLQLHNDLYRGTITLPMFGHYKVQLVEVAGGARRQGSARLDLPLTLGN